MREFQSIASDIDDKAAHCANNEDFEPSREYEAHNLAIYNHAICRWKKQKYHTYTSKALGSNLSYITEEALSA